MPSLGLLPSGLRELSLLLRGLQSQGGGVCVVNRSLVKPFETITLIKDDKNPLAFSR